MTTHACYDDVGRVVSARDANGNTTTYTHDATDTFVVGTQLPTPASGVTIATAAQFDTHTGLQTSSTDENGNVTTYTYDSMLRPHTITFPTTSAGQPVTTYSYPSPNQVGVSKLIGGGQSTDTETLKDGYGRTSRVAVLDGQTSNPWIQTDTCYDSRGSVSFVSSPYNGTGFGTTQVCSGNGVGYSYDALGRVLSLTHADGGVQSTTYSGGAAGEIIDTWDEALVHWQRTTDGFGRLIKTLELGSSASPLHFETDYGYDALSNLTGISQLGETGDTARNRSFVYDSLSRLITSTNPETGTICYGLWSGSNCVNGYDGVGNLKYKTDARGTTTTYSYDTLNRLTAKSYSDGTTPVGFGYDGHDQNGNYMTSCNGNPTSPAPCTNAIGRLSYLWTPVGAATVYSFDTMGRVTVENSFLPTTGWNNTASATYDLAGNMTGLTYPDGRKIQQAFDNAGRVLTSNQVDGSGTAIASYLQGVTYLPDSSPSTTTLGNGVQQTVTENSRMQIAAVSVSNPLGPFDGQTFLSHTYCYNSTCGTSNNNGNIFQINDTLNAANTQAFTYDSLNRITSFSLGGATNQQFQTDAFGNMCQVSGCNPATWFDPASNRVNAANLPCAAYVSSAYDAAGNQLCNSDSTGVNVFTYDAENRVSTAALASSPASPFETYLYSADGARVEKLNANNSTLTEYVNFAGAPIAELDGSGNWTDYIYADGRKIAMASRADRVFRTSGGTTGSWGLGRFDFAIPQNPVEGGNYTVQAGDKMCWRQNNPTVYGGVAMTFNNGGDSIGQGLLASDGQLAHNMPTSTGWVNRCIDLTLGGTVIGAQMNYLYLVSYDFAGTATSWSTYYADMSIFSVNGQVIPILNGQMPTSAAISSAGYEGNLAAMLESNTSIDGTSGAATHFYTGDHLGSAQLELSSGGWPVWQGHFAPYGEELQSGALLPPDLPDGSTNHYKFTGKERDAETGLDYFGARYYGSTTGRWMSPDWAANPQAVPYASLANPQTFNLYGYVGNNPLSQRDADGHNFDAPSTYAGDVSNTPPDASGNSHYAVIEANEEIEEAEYVARMENTIASDAAQAQQQYNQTQTVTIIVTSDTVAGKEFGSHAAIWLDNGPDGAALYDPGGSYHQDTRGTGGVLTQEDDHASLQDYIKYQESSGSKVSTVNIKISSKDEATIYQHASDNGERRGLHWAADVSRAVSGVGPFKNVKEVFLPGTLLKEARSIAASQ